MKKFVGSIWAKAAAFIIFCVSAVLSVGCVIILSAGQASEFGFSQVPFSESPFCRGFVSERLEQVAEHIYWNGADVLIEDRLFFESKSFSYKVKDEYGRVLVDTTGKDSKSVIGNLTRAGKGKEYTLEGFINLPIERGDEAYLYKALYDYSGNALLVGIVSVFAAIISFIFLMTAAGKNTEGEVVMVGLNRLPWDLFAGAAAIACVIPAAGFNDVFYWGLSLRSIAAFCIWSLCFAVIGMAFCFGMAARFKVRGQVEELHNL